MAGIVVMSVVGVWIVMAYFLSKRATNRLVKGKGKKAPVFIGLFFVLLIVPILDDIIIGIEFRNLCKKYSIIEIDIEAAAGSSVYHAGFEDKEYKGLFLRASLSKGIYRDFKTREILISYHFINSGGGFLTNLYPGMAPLTFKGSCRPEKNVNNKWLKEFDINKVEKPDET